MSSAKALGEHVLIDNGLYLLASNKYVLRDMRFGMYDQQSLRSACAYAQSDQSLCWSLEYSIGVKLLTEQHLTSHMVFHCHQKYKEVKKTDTGQTNDTYVTHIQK